MRGSSIASATLASGAICTIPALKQRYDIQGAADPLAAVCAVIAQADQESH